MPTFGYERPKDQYKRIEAWRAHYRAKGCSASKANRAAMRKLYTGTWPE